MVPERAAAPSPAAAPAPRSRAPRDPFFDQPYVPSAEAQAAWDGKVPAQPRTSLSPNIKPKKKVAALFGAKCTSDGTNDDSASS